MQQSSLDILADLLQRYIGEIGRSAHCYAEVCNRGTPSAEDLVGFVLHWRWHLVGSDCPQTTRYWGPAEERREQHTSSCCSACYVCRCQSAGPCEAAANQDICCRTRMLGLDRCSVSFGRLRSRNVSRPPSPQGLGAGAGARLLLNEVASSLGAKTWSADSGVLSS